MTRILVQRGSAGSSTSSNQNRSTSVPSPAPSSSASLPQQVTSIAQVTPAVKDEILGEELCEQIVVDELAEVSGGLGNISKEDKSEDLFSGSSNSDHHENDKSVTDETVHLDDGANSGHLTKAGPSVIVEENDTMVGSSLQMVTSTPYPPPPPVPPPKPSSVNSSSRSTIPSDSNVARIGPSRRPSGWPGVPGRSSPTGSHPSSPRSYSEAEGYNSADEQSPHLYASYDDAVSLILNSLYFSLLFFLGSLL